MARVTEFFKVDSAILDPDQQSLARMHNLKAAVKHLAAKSTLMPHSVLDGTNQPTRS